MFDRYISCHHHFFFALTGFLSLDECKYLIRSVLEIHKTEGAPILSQGLRDVMEPARTFLVECGINTSDEFDERVESAVDTMTRKLDAYLETLIDESDDVSSKLFHSMDANHDDKVSQQEFVDGFVKAACKTIHLQTLLRPPQEFDSFEE